MHRLVSARSRRGPRFGAVSLFALCAGLLLLAALTSYLPPLLGEVPHIQQPSDNLCGGFGFYLAHYLYTFLGVMAFLPIALLLWRALHSILGGTIVERRLPRVLAGLSAVALAGAGLFGAFPAGEGAALADGYGGYLGGLVWRVASAVLGRVGGALALVLLLVFAFMAILRFSLPDWRVGPNNRRRIHQSAGRKTESETPASLRTARSQSSRRRPVLSDEDAEMLGFTRARGTRPGAPTSDTRVGRRPAGADARDTRRPPIHTTPVFVGIPGQNPHLRPASAPSGSGGGDVARRPRPRGDREPVFTDEDAQLLGFRRARSQETRPPRTDAPQRPIVRPGPRPSAPSRPSVPFDGQVRCPEPPLPERRAETPEVRQPSVSGAMSLRGEDVGALTRPPLPRGEEERVTPLPLGEGPGGRADKAAPVPDIPVAPTVADSSVSPVGEKAVADAAGSLVVEKVVAEASAPPVVERPVVVSVAAPPVAEQVAADADDNTDTEADADTDTVGPLVLERAHDGEPAPPDAPTAEDTPPPEPPQPEEQAAEEFEDIEDIEVAEDTEEAGARADDADLSDIVPHEVETAAESSEFSDNDFADYAAADTDAEMDSDSDEDEETEHASDTAGAAEEEEEIEEEETEEEEIEEEEIEEEEIEEEEIEEEATEEEATEEEATEEEEADEAEVSPDYGAEAEVEDERDEDVDSPDCTDEEGDDVDDTADAPDIAVASADESEEAEETETEHDEDEYSPLYVVDPVADHDEEPLWPDESEPGAAEDEVYAPEYTDREYADRASDYADESDEPRYTDVDDDSIEDANERYGEFDEEEDDYAAGPSGPTPRFGPPEPDPEEDDEAEAETPGPPPEPVNRWEHYVPPPLDLLDDNPQMEAELDQEHYYAVSRTLTEKLLAFNVQGEVVGIAPGPVVTTYEFAPAPHVKISRIMSLADDLAMALTVDKVRVAGAIAGKAAVGIEVPNPERSTVYLKDILQADEYQEARSRLTLALGFDVVGRPTVANLAKMPHLLIAGATGAGKSVAINAFISSILFRARPDEVKLLMIDPKRIELSGYDDIPHLLHPVVVEAKMASRALLWAVREMERRYQLLETYRVKSIDSYNATAAEPLPYIVIIVDELADLMMVASKDVETSIARLAQKARAAGMHIILATQRPSVDVLTGLIKANFPTRISFKVSQKVDSRTILDQVGAEHLLGMGDMLYLPPGKPLQRVHGAFISERETERLVEYLKTQGTAEYDESVLQDMEEDAPDPSVSSGAEEDEYDEKYDEAVAVVTEMATISVSMLQRRLRVGYNRAARMIDLMEREGIVGPADGSKPREVLVRSHGGGGAGSPE